jgi:VWA domain-containing protein
VESETARLRRSCHRLVWLNPLAGTAGYQPLAAGMRAAFPYIDDFLPAGSIASLERLGEILAGVRASDPDRGREAAAHLAPDLSSGAGVDARAPLIATSAADPAAPPKIS